MLDLSHGSGEVKSPFQRIKFLKKITGVMTKILSHKNISSILNTMLITDN